MLIRPDKGLLTDIVQLMSVTGEMRCQLEDLAFISRDKQAESPFIAADRRLDQTLVTQPVCLFNDRAFAMFSFLWIIYL